LQLTVLVRNDHQHMVLVGPASCVCFVFHGGEGLPNLGIFWIILSSGLEVLGLQRTGLISTVS
jgi:hypothetical protein